MLHLDVLLWQVVDGWMACFQHPPGTLAVGDQTSPADIELPVYAGINDLLATVEVQASPDARGSFKIEIDSATLVLFDRDGNEVPGFDAIELAGATIIVPEPTAWPLIVCGVVLAWRCGVRRHRCAGVEALPLEG